MRSVAIGIAVDRRLLAPGRLILAVTIAVAAIISASWSGLLVRRLVIVVLSIFFFAVLSLFDTLPLEHGNLASDSILIGITDIAVIRDRSDRLFVGDG